MEKALIQNYLRQLQSIYEGDNWIDESFAKKLTRLTEEEAFKQPGPGVHSVAEVLSHLVEWRKELINRFESDNPPALFMDSEPNWFDNEKLREAGWKKLKEAFAETQRNLITLWGQLDDSFLAQKYQGEYPYHYLVEGILHHDLYHLGQIGLIIKIIRIRQ